VSTGRPLRVCFAAYRGNMNCGGQGVYLFYLARELARQGHRVDVLVGPPYPAPMPFARSVQELHDDQFWGKWFFSDRRRLLPEPPLWVCAPLLFSGPPGSRMGFLPEPLAFSVRAFRALAARLARGERFDVVH